MKQQNLKACAGCGDWRRPYDLLKLADSLLCSKCRKLYSTCAECHTLSRKDNLNKVLVDKKEVFICDSCFADSPTIKEKQKKIK